MLVFPPLGGDNKYSILPYFWIPEENLDLRVCRDHVPYDVWEKQGFLQTTEGNVVHYGYIVKFIEGLEERVAHGGHPVLRWMMDNIYIRTDPAGNIKLGKEKSSEKIDGAVATVMALDRAIRCGNDTASLCMTVEEFCSCKIENIMIFYTYAGEKFPVVYERRYREMSRTSKVLTVSSVVLLLL